MISTVDCSNYLSTFYTFTFIAAFIVAVFTCVCNPKSKRFHKHKSFILSHDLPNDVPPNTDLNQSPNIHHNPNQTSEIIEANNQLKIIPHHRALPDIPQAGTVNICSLDNPFANSTSFADVNSNDDVDSLYTVANNNVSANLQNHPYARIRSNIIVDSSTENDTDDYSDSRVATIQNVQCHNEPSQFRAALHESNDTYELEPQPHILRLQIRNNIEPSLFNNEVESESKKEISYNTISVREPLSKVLAERENIEHHYNEVEDERISSFYEEITTGSATYSKINDGNEEEHTFGMEPVPSTSRQTNDDVLNGNLQFSAVAVETNGPLYSFVDKKMKRTNLPANPAGPLPEANNLYTKVVKSPASGVKIVDSKPILQRYSPPPPLPPPFNKDTQTKLYRNTIMFGTPSTSNGISRNFSPFSDVEQQNVYQIITQKDSEKDPGYETVYKKVDNCEKSDSTQNDYGYEAILIDESDPAYEILKPDNGYETIKTFSQEDQSDPNYEIIPSTSSLVHLPPTDTSPGRYTTQSIDENVIIEHL